MGKRILGAVGILIIFSSLICISWTSSSSAYTLPLKATRTTDSLSGFEKQVTDIYNAVHLADAGLNPVVFEKALTGFYNLKVSGEIPADKFVLSVADFDQSSTQKRFWVIDLNKKTLLMHTWVAHGVNSGYDFPTRFSNSGNSNQSSIGFYVTGETYFGKHGKSLKLNGMDTGFNSNARKRSIVMHGADYVSQTTINQLGRLGRSHGCPAVPSFLADSIINTIKDGTVLFINYSNLKEYSSKYLSHSVAPDTSNTMNTFF